jgi:hypothetical protein
MSPEIERLLREHRDWLASRGLPADAYSDADILLGAMRVAEDARIRLSGHGGGGSVLYVSGEASAAMLESRWAGDSSPLADDPGTEWWGLHPITRGYCRMAQGPDGGWHPVDESPRVSQFWGVHPVTGKRCEMEKLPDGKYRPLEKR